MSSKPNIKMKNVFADVPESVRLLVVRKKEKFS